MKDGTLNKNGYNYFDPDKEISKYGLDHSTFDLIDVGRFRNTRPWTIISYLISWTMIVLSLVLLGSDIYTCVNILAFNRWSSADYKPYAYKVAKWIFTGCIIFEFVLLLYHWVWAIHTYKTKNIALAYVNSIARQLYVVKSFSYFCLFSSIEHDNFFDWSAFLSYGELDNALQILVADCPRQVINILTLQYYATGGGKSNDIISNIKSIAEKNLRLSIILSFMCLSLIIWCIFFFKFVLGMILYIPVMVGIRDRGFKSLKKYCCSIVNENVRILVYRNHKTKGELLEKGILSLDDIAENPLLNKTNTAFESVFEYSTAPKDIESPPAIHEIANRKQSQSSLYDNSKSLVNLNGNNTDRRYEDFSQSSSSLTSYGGRKFENPESKGGVNNSKLLNPFGDQNRIANDSSVLSETEGPISSNKRFRRPPPPIGIPRKTLNESVAGYQGSFSSDNSIMANVRNAPSNDIESTVKTTYDDNIRTHYEPFTSSADDECSSSRSNTFSYSQQIRFNNARADFTATKDEVDPGNHIHSSNSNIGTRHVSNKSLDHVQVEYSGDDSFDTDSDSTPLSPESKNTPYPVRGVSMYGE